MFVSVVCTFEPKNDDYESIVRKTVEVVKKLRALLGDFDIGFGDGLVMMINNTWIKIRASVSCDSGCITISIHAPARSKDALDVLLVVGQTVCSEFLALEEKEQDQVVEYPAENLVYGG